MSGASWCRGMYMSSDPGGDGLRRVARIRAYRALATPRKRALPSYPFSKCLFCGKGKLVPASVCHGGLGQLGGNVPLLDLVDQHAARCTSFSSSVQLAGADCRALRSTAGGRIVEVHIPWGRTEHRRSRRCSLRGWSLLRCGEISTVSGSTQGAPAAVGRHPLSIGASEHGSRRPLPRWTTPIHRHFARRRSPLPRRLPVGHPFFVPMTVSPNAYVRRVTDWRSRTVSRSVSPRQQTASLHVNTRPNGPNSPPTTASISVVAHTSRSACMRLRHP